MASPVEEDQPRYYMRLALAEARRSPPKPTNFCVGACIVAAASSSSSAVSSSEASSFPPPLATGYTLECEGNTHAEQCCFLKLAAQYNCRVADLGAHLPESVLPLALYTTMEPCNKRSVGNTPCVDRVLDVRRPDGRPAIGTVYIGVSEPETFVGVNAGQRRLEDAGIRVVPVPGFEEEILAVATAGHKKEPS